MILILFGVIIQQDLSISLTIAGSMMGVIIIAALIGTFVPIILNKRGIDPAIATGPFITTANDIFVFFFSLYGQNLFGLLISQHESFTPRGKSPHPDQGLQALGFKNDAAYTDSLAEILAKVDQYEGLIIRSKYPIDEDFWPGAKKLKFIGRVGAGLENIDVKAVESRNIHLLNAPEGNRNAVGEHALGMLFVLDESTQQDMPPYNPVDGIREGHRGWELSGRTVGIIGYGNTGKSFAYRISGFDVKTLCYDILDNVGDQYAKQVDWENPSSRVRNHQPPHSTNPTDPWHDR